MTNYMAKTLAATRRRANVVPKKKDELRLRWNEKEQKLSAQIFSTLKAEVNKICKEAFHGMSADSLVDYHWHDDFDANLQPWESVNEAVEFWTPDHPGIDEAWEQYIIKGIAYA